jgi:hypothetical protein
MKPIITVVTGTINRLPLLKRMVESARREARGLPIDFIIVDNGSTDGTEAWCRTQPDITFVQMGKPVGGIKAFTEGGKLSQARYTILANDDIAFMPYSILSAYRCLEDNPHCGAVAFADNRLSPNQAEPVYATQKHFTRSEDGRVMLTTYAQVGMYRTPLMITAGVWGGDDPLFGGAGAWTYGGDNYLSARIHEMGYAICETKLAKIHDYVHQDEMRAVNTSKHPNDARLYHLRFDPSRYGRGAIYNSHRHEAPTMDTEPKVRVLYMPEIEPMQSPQLAQQKGLSHAFMQAGFDTIQFAYTIEAIHSPTEMRQKLLNLINVFKPDLCFMQAHSANLITPETMTKMRSLHPSMVVVNWNGDYWRDKLFAPRMVELLKLVDCQLVVDYAVIERYRQLGIKAYYWQIAPETPNVSDIIEDVPSYDVLFLGTVYSEARLELVTFLDGLRQKGFNVGLYGMSYPSHIKTNGTTYYDYRYTHALMQKAGVVIGAMEFADSDGYVSNRLFEALQAGAVLLQQTVINADIHLGLVNGVHYATWDTLEDLEPLIDYYLRHRDLALDIAQRGQQHIWKHHQWGNRVQELINILERIDNDNPRLE